MRFSPSIVIALVKGCQLWLAELGGEAGPCPTDPALPMSAYVLCSGVSAGRGWPCLPAALSSRGLGGLV